MLHIESRQFSATTPAFNLPHLHLASLLGWLHLNFAEIFGIRKLEFLVYCVALFAWSYI